VNFYIQFNLSNTSVLFVSLNSMVSIQIEVLSELRQSCSKLLENCGFHFVAAVTIDRSHLTKESNRSHPQGDLP
jgi:hypothetical protein